MKPKALSPDAFIAQARAKGLTVTERPTNLGALLVSEPVSEPTKPLLLPSVHLPPNVWVVGVETRSESNQRDWKGRSNRTKKAREATCKLFGQHLATLAVFADHYHAGGSVLIEFTRLAPRRLDRGNVSVSLKAVEDALALLMGADDGDARWRAWYKQEASERYGVRIKLGVGT